MLMTEGEAEGLGVIDRGFRMGVVGASTVPETKDPTAAMASFIVSDAVVDAARVKIREDLTTPCLIVEIMVCERMLHKMTKLRG